MKPLEACQIAVAAHGSDETVRARIVALEQAGAQVRFCVLSQDLWSTLSETAFDLIVVLADRTDLAGLTIYRQLREHARTRSVPSLLLSNPADLVATDITDSELIAVALERVAPQRALREAEARERELREQLREELSRADDAKRELSELSHELRSVLDGVFGFGCNLRDELPGPLAPDQKQHVAGILEGVERASKLLARATSGPSRPSRTMQAVSPSTPARAQRTLVHLARLASEVCAWFQASAARKSQRLDCVCDETVFVWGDQLKLKQVITNLTVNALKYTPAGGRVTVSVAWSKPSGDSGVQARRNAEISVADSGPGIPLQHRDRIFERGFRLQQDSDVPGEGIGLAVVKDVVTQHGGFVRVEGEPGAGAIFAVSLPQDRRQRARSQNPSEGEPGA
jgi:signal transduction histidine kinase